MREDIFLLNGCVTQMRENCAELRRVTPICAKLRGTVMFCARYLTEHVRICVELGAAARIYANLCKTARRAARICKIKQIVPPVKPEETSRRKSTRFSCGENNSLLKPKLFLFSPALPRLS